MGHGTLISIKIILNVHQNVKNMLKKKKKKTYEAFRTMSEKGQRHPHIGPYKFVFLSIEMWVLFLKKKKKSTVD